MSACNPSPEKGKTTKPERFDIHQHITDQIVAAIENGAGEFKLPWHRSAWNIFRPVNVATKKPYRGVNIISLWASADARGYKSRIWGTFRQWADAGCSVRKGEKAAYIVFYKQIEITSGKGEAEDSETRQFARARPGLCRRAGGRRRAALIARHARDRHRAKPSSMAYRNRKANQEVTKAKISL